MNFDLFILLPNSSMVHLSHSVFIFAGKPIKTNLCCSNIHENVAFHQSIVDLPGAILLEKIDSPAP